MGMFFNADKCNEALTCVDCLKVNEKYKLLLEFVESKVKLQSVIYSPEILEEKLSLSRECIELLYKIRCI